MAQFDPEKAIAEAARVSWYNFLAPRSFPAYKNETSLEVANWYATTYQREVNNLQFGRAVWAWIAIFFAIIAAIGWLK